MAGPRKGSDKTTTRANSTSKLDAEKNKAAKSTINILCRKCFKKAEGDVIQCDSCSKWLHKECTTLNSREFDILQLGNHNILFSCEDCEVYKGAENKRMLQLEKRIEEIATQTLKIDALSDIVKTLQQQNEMILNLYKNCSEEKIEAKIDIKITETLEEQKQKDEIKNNAIIFNIEEREGEGEEADKEDVEIVKQVLKTVNPSFDTSLLNQDTVQRLGKKRTKLHTNSNGNLLIGQSCNRPVKPRPLRVVFPNQSQKMAILKNAKKLKDNENMSKIGITNEKTHKQREADSKLREELKARKEMGDDVMIYRGSVILRKDRDSLAAAVSRTETSGSQNSI